MAGLQFGENRVTIDSVVWVQNINVTDTQPRRNSCPNVLRLAAETENETMRISASATQRTKLRTRRNVFKSLQIAFHDPQSSIVVRNSIGVT